MYIMINNIPVNIQLLELYPVTSLDTKDFSDINFRNGLLRSACNSIPEYKELCDKDMDVDTYFSESNKILKKCYGFYLKYKTPLSDKEYYIPSIVSRNKEEVQKKLDELTSLINKIESNLPKIEI